MAKSTELILVSTTEYSTDDQSTPRLPIKAPTELQIAGQVANYHAAQRRFDDYLSRKADNTVVAQRSDLLHFSVYLHDVGVQNTPNEDQLQTDPLAWRGVTWGLVDGFVKWQLTQGHAITSINRRLSTIKVYAKLASQAGLMHRNWR